MSLMLKRGIEVLVGAALVVVLLAVLPAVAQAQNKGAPQTAHDAANRGAGAAPERVVVSPGDTLWTIAEEHLGPKATPPQIAGMLEQIYALNRDRIGPDPNLIVVGQELSLPAPAGASSAESAGAAAQVEHKVEHTIKETAKEKGEPADQPVQQVLLPKVPASAAVPAVGSLATDSSAVASFAESMSSAVMSAVTAVVTSASAALAGALAEVHTTANGRLMLGWGIIAFTLLTAALLAWKLPMKRSVGNSEVWDYYPDFRVRYYPGDYLGYADTEKVLDSNGLKAQATAQATAAEKGRGPLGPAVIAQKRKQLTMRRASKGSPRRSSAAEAYSVEARRFSREAVLRTRPRKPRNSRVKTARRFAAQRIAQGGRSQWR